MKTRFYSSLILLLAFAFQLEAQRYLVPQFGVERTPDITYGTNISVLTGTPAPLDLQMDIYTPVGDTSTTPRPLILVAHTGSFLPPIFNGQATGWQYDSTVIYTCGALASMGYVVAAYTYRQGWLPTSPDEDIRRSTLLQAAYRGIQDTRTAVRYFRKDANENGNTWNIDPDKIGIVGIGTGGYLALGAGSLHEIQEIETDKFINTQTALPYIDTTIMGNLYATTQAAICLPNHPNYSSDIDFSFNLGGALGDTEWLDGEEREPAYAGVHCVNDIFAPFHEGPVIVPTTNEFVLAVSGTRSAIETANNLGSNDILNDIPPAFDGLAPLIEFQKQTDVTLLTGATIKMGTDNFYAFNRPVPEGSPWDWWGIDDLRMLVAGINFQFNTNYNADTIHLSGLATNPDMSAAKAKAHFDTIFALMLPRACAALNLGCFPVDVKDLTDDEVSLEMGPNPATTEVRIKSSYETPMQSVYLYDLQGRLVKADVDLNTSEYLLKRHQLANGVYLAKLNFEGGTLTKKITFQ